MFNVNPKTVTRWAESGQLTSSARWADTAASASPRAGIFLARPDPRRLVRAAAAELLQPALIMELLPTR